MHAFCMFYLYVSLGFSQFKNQIPQAKQTQAFFQTSLVEKKMKFLKILQENALFLQKSYKIL